jgi:hypothetical protein
MAQTAHAHHCRDSPQHGYQRHRPEQTALYQIVAANWHKFLERAQEAGGVPDFVKREFDAFLDCGILERGHVLIACPSCGFERAVAFSCKRRGGICPSCMGRRMNDTAAHLVDRVLPLTTPIRQWVCSMPHSLRYLMGYDKKLSNLTVVEDYNITRFTRRQVGFGRRSRPVQSKSDEKRSFAANRTRAT